MDSNDESCFYNAQDGWEALHLIIFKSIEIFSAELFHYIHFNWIFKVGSCIHVHMILFSGQSLVLSSKNMKAESQRKK